MRAAAAPRRRQRRPQRPALLRPAARRRLPLPRRAGASKATMISNLVTREEPMQSSCSCAPAPSAPAAAGAAGGLRLVALRGLGEPHVGHAVDVVHPRHHARDGALRVGAADDRESGAGNLGAQRGSVSARRLDLDVGAHRAGDGQQPDVAGSRAGELVDGVVPVEAALRRPARSAPGGPSGWSRTGRRGAARRRPTWRRPPCPSARRPCWSSR